MTSSSSFMLALLLVLLLVPLGVDGQTQGTGVKYELIIDCPSLRATFSTSGTCPVQATDPDDAMGDPELAVDPISPENLIIASLHGSPDCGGPSVRSRCG